jgi:hypothetical protein
MQRYIDSEARLFVADFDHARFLEDDYLDDREADSLNRKQKLNAGGRKVPGSVALVFSYFFIQRPHKPLRAAFQTNKSLSSAGFLQSHPSEMKEAKKISKSASAAGKEPSKGKLVSKRLCHRLK